MNTENEMGVETVRSEKIARSMKVKGDLNRFDK